MGKNQAGPKNNFWKGGKTISEHGYILIRVGKEHPLADIRGYVYEHRLIASEMIGRFLFDTEIVHHIDSNKKNNDPSNLKVTIDLAHHFLEHRKVGSNRRLPNEPNISISCACGCGSVFHKYDNTGRPRIYINGHNPPSAPTMTMLLSILKISPKRLCDLYQIGISSGAIKSALSKMKAKGFVNNIRHGIWEYIGNESKDENSLL